MLLPASSLLSCSSFCCCASVAAAAWQTRPLFRAVRGVGLVLQAVSRLRPPRSCLFGPREVLRTVGMAYGSEGISEDCSALVTLQTDGLVANQLKCLA